MNWINSSIPWISLKQKFLFVLNLRAPWFSCNYSCLHISFSYLVISNWHQLLKNIIKTTWICKWGACLTLSSFKSRSQGEVVYLEEPSTKRKETFISYTDPVQDVKLNFIHQRTYQALRMTETISTHKCPAGSSAAVAILIETYEIFNQATPRKRILTTAGRLSWKLSPKVKEKRKSLWHAE